MAKRPYAAGAFAMTIDGTGGGFIGFVSKIGGGKMGTTMSSHQQGPRNLQVKQAGNLKYDAFSVDVGMGMARGMYEWINQSLDMQWVAHNGSIHSLNQNYRSQFIREFYDALITEVTFPTLDANTENNVYMTLKLDPREIKFRPGDNNEYLGEEGPSQKDWVSSNFRLRLGDLPCANVMKIDSFTWKQNVISHAIGDARCYEKIPSKVEVPNLKIEISMSDVDQWADWAEVWLAGGDTETAKHLNGELEILNPSRTKTLATLKLDRVGLISAQCVDAEANSDKPAAFAVEVYVEDLRFEGLQAGTDA
jgi:hypothetical protein